MQVLTSRLLLPLYSGGYISEETDSSFSRTVVFNPYRFKTRLGKCQFLAFALFFEYRKIIAQVSCYEDLREAVADHSVFNSLFS